MNDTEDWLETAAPQLPAIVESESKYARMVEALRLCSPKQRHYLAALQAACFDDEAARKELATKGIRVSWRTLRHWEIMPAFVTALNSSIEYSLAAAAVSQVGVLAQLQRAVRVNGQVIKCRTEDGMEYERFVDSNALNAALDKLAKRVRMYSDSELPVVSRPGPGLVITFVHPPDTHPIIDVTPDKAST